MGNTYMYGCRKCEKLCSLELDSPTKHVYCDDCELGLIYLGYTTEEWDALPEDVRHDVLVKKHIIRADPKPKKERPRWNKFKAMFSKFKTIFFMCIMGALAFWWVFVVVSGAISCAVEHKQERLATPSPTAQYRVEFHPETPKQTYAPKTTFAPVSIYNEDEDDNDGVIDFSEARDYVGQRVVLQGTVMGTAYAPSSHGSPTYLNIGYDYPSSSRVTVLIWGGDRKNFLDAPEKYYRGKKIKVSGTISLYKGVPQIEVKSSSAIEVIG